MQPIKTNGALPQWCLPLAFARVVSNGVRGCQDLFAPSSKIEF